MEERLRALQRAVAMLETEKKDAERQAVRLEKDKNALRNTLDKVSAVSTRVCFFVKDIRFICQLRFKMTCRAL